MLEYRPIVNVLVLCRPIVNSVRVSSYCKCVSVKCVSSVSSYCKCVVLECRPIVNVIVLECRPIVNVLVLVVLL